MEKKVFDLINFLNYDNYLTCIKCIQDGIETNCIGLFNFLIKNNQLICIAEPISYLDGDNIIIEISKIDDLKFDLNCNTYFMEVGSVHINFSKTE